MLRRPRASLLLAALAAALLPGRADAVRLLAQGLRKPQGLSRDPLTGSWYWVEAGARKISRADADFASVEDVVVMDSDEEAPYDLALDPVAGKAYWTSNSNGIRRANLNGTGQETLLSADGAGGIALFVEQGKMYWTSRRLGTINRASLDGTLAEELVNASGANVTALVLDRIAQRMYWADVTVGRVMSANLDGSDVQVLEVSWATLMTYGMAMDNQGKIYLTDNDASRSERTGRILRANLDGSHSEVLLAQSQQSSMQEPFGILFDASSAAVFWTDRTAGTIQRLTLSCSPGTLAVSSKSNHSVLQVAHNAMSHGGLYNYPCLVGYQGALGFACSDGVVSVSSGQCSETCAAADYLQTQSITARHPEIPDGATVEKRCPRGMAGSVVLSCDDGIVDVVSRTCRYMDDCLAANTSFQNAMVSTPATMHGDVANVSCPENFFGGYTGRCDDGDFGVLSGSCRPSCGAGDLWVDGGAVKVSHSAILRGHTLTVVCPEGSAGDGIRLECVAAGRDYISIEGGSCAQSTLCEAGTQEVNGANVSFAAMDEGGRTAAECPPGFSGRVNFTCLAGSASVLDVGGGGCYRHCDSGTLRDGGSGEQVAYEAVEHGATFFALCPDFFHGVIPLTCLDGNVTLACQLPQGCPCVPVYSRTESLTLGLLSLTVFLLLAIIAVICYSRYCGKAKPARSLGRTGSALPLRALKLGVPSGAGSSSRAAREYASPSSKSRSRSTTASGEASPPFSVIVCPILPLPGYWATRDGVHIFPDPNRITEVQQLMSDTWRACFTRDRVLVGGDHRVPTGCRVANILRIENHAAYERYATHKDELAAERRGCVEPFPMATDNRLSPLDADVNEKYLFHGTNPEAAHTIARDFFRMDMAGAHRGSMFGPGIYLAENASKSDEYAKEGAGVYVGLCAMLLCRAVSGRVLTVDAAADYSDSVRSGEYDSVCGDRLAAAGTFREMVYFHEEAVYPEFIVIYARVYD